MLLCGIKSIKADENFIWLVLWLQYSRYFFLFLQKCLCHITFFLHSVLVLLLPFRKRVRVFFSCIHKKRESIFYIWFFPTVAICFSTCICWFSVPLYSHFLPVGTSGFCSQGSPVCFAQTQVHCCSCHRIIDFLLFPYLWWDWEKDE